MTQNLLKLKKRLILLNAENFGTKIRQKKIQNRFWWLIKKS